MAYAGRVQPAYFSTVGTSCARCNYLEHSGGDPQLWDETQQAAKELGEPYGSTVWVGHAWCYLFFCTKCTKRRCNWDCG